MSSQVLGTVALEHKTKDEAELRRMSVRRNVRRGGIGQMLLQNLEDWARSQGYKDVFLSTGGHMPSAQQFYAKNGYTLEKVEDLREDQDYLKEHFDPLPKAYYYRKKL